VAEEEELVAQPGEVPGEAQGPDRMAVAGTVDPIKNFGHMVWQCKPPGAQGQSPREKTAISDQRSAISY
jgi:hypothetical protein